LEHQLGETVGHVILDLEHLLEDFDRSITMLRRIRNVLEQVERLGAPAHEVQALLANCQRPEALPSLAQGTRRLIQVALDDIYLEADQRNAGEALGLEETARVLEELITQLDASGLTDGRPRGMMWEFQRDGLLPYERESIPAEQRLPVQDELLEDLEPHLLHAEVVSTAPTSSPEVDDEGWEALHAPVDGEPEEQHVQVESRTTMPDLDSERAQLEAELARLDAERSHRQSPVTSQPVPADAALADLESRLSNLDF